MLRNFEKLRKRESRSTRDYYCATRSQRFSASVRVFFPSTPSHMCAFSLPSYLLVYELMLRKRGKSRERHRVIFARTITNPRQFSTCHLTFCDFELSWRTLFRAKCSKLRGEFSSSSCLPFNFPQGPRPRGDDPRPAVQNSAFQLFPFPLARDDASSSSPSSSFSSLTFLKLCSLLLPLPYLCHTHMDTLYAPF